MPHCGPGQRREVDRGAKCASGFRTVALRQNGQDGSVCGAGSSAEGGTPAQPVVRGGGLRSPAARREKHAPPRGPDPDRPLKISLRAKLGLYPSESACAELPNSACFSDLSKRPVCRPAPARGNCRHWRTRQPRGLFAPAPASWTASRARPDVFDPGRPGWSRRSLSQSASTSQNGLTRSKRNDSRLPPPKSGRCRNPALPYRLVQSSRAPSASSRNRAAPEGDPAPHASAGREDPARCRRPSARPHAGLVLPPELEATDFGATLTASHRGARLQLQQPRAALCQRPWRP